MNSSHAIGQQSMVAEIPSFINELGPFPILQFWAGVAVLGIGVFAFIRGTRREVTPEENLEHTLRFDGPIAVAIRMMERSAVACEDVRKELYKISENGRTMNAILTDVRNDLRFRDKRDEGRR